MQDSSEILGPVWQESQKEAVAKKLAQVLPTLYSMPWQWDISLLACSENLTFLLACEEGKRIVRVNRKGYHTVRELEAELQWMATLETDVAVSLPQVIAGKDGRYVQSLGDENDSTCCMFSFLGGVSLGGMQEKELSETLRQLGSIAARMHLHAMQDKTRYDRFSWDYDALFGTGKRWGDWKSYRGVLQEDVPIIEQALKVISTQLGSYGKDRSKYALIHADLHVSNVLLSPDGSLQILDFDDCGYGWFLYDLACILVTYCQNLDGLAGAVLHGYEQVRGLGATDRELFVSFILMRRIARYAWLASHSESDTAKMVDDGLYREVTMILCNQVLNRGY